METVCKAAQRITTSLLKDFSIHTATSLSKELKISRQGAWKILRKLEKEGLIVLEQIGSGRTGARRVRLNWDNEALEKTLALSLIQEALQHQRWRFNFAELKQEVEFLILYGSILHSPKKAGDVDIIGVAHNEKKLAKISDKILKAQETQTMKIHSINLTKKELEQELKRPNKAYAEAVRKGVVLFGHENFIKFMRGLQKW